MAMMGTWSCCSIFSYSRISLVAMNPSITGIYAVALRYCQHLNGTSLPGSP